MSDQAPNDDESPQSAGDAGTFGWPPPSPESPPAVYPPEAPPPAYEAPQPQYPAQPQYPPPAYEAPQPQYPAQPQYPPPSYPPTYPAAQYPPQPQYPPPNEPQYGSTILPVGPAGQAPPRDMLTAGPRVRGHRSKRNATSIVLTLLVVVAIIVGGVVYVGRHKSTSAAGQPDQWAPGNSVAYVKVDLDPSGAEAANVLKFEQTFPDAPKAANPADLKDALLTAAFNEPGDNLGYATDVEPWLGSKAALAVFPDASGGESVVGIVQVTDATKAKAGLAKLVQDENTDDADAAASAGPQSAAPDDTIVASGSNTPIGYTIEGDYAVIGQSQAMVTAAVAAARTSNIGTNANYAADIATLKGTPIMTAWADLGPLVKLGQALDNESGLTDRFGSLGDVKTGSIKGRAVMGLEFGPTTADLQGRIVGDDVSEFTNGTASATLGELPAGTVAGVAVSGLSTSLQNELTALEKMPVVAGEVQKEFDAYSSELGISVPADALNLLGNEFAIGLDKVPTGQNPNNDDPGGVKLTAITQPNDVTRGLTTAKVLTGLAGNAGMTLSATARGQQIVVTNDPDASGSLSGDPGYQAALAGMPANVQGAMYIDLGALVSGVATETSQTEPPDEKHLGSIGSYDGIEGNAVVFGVKLTLQ